MLSGQLNHFLRIIYMAIQSSGEAPVALVTGASRGIGRAIAQRLGRNGVIVAVHYARDGDAAKAVVASIEQEGGRAFAIQADLSQDGSAKALWQAFDESVQTYAGRSGVDIVVNNAGGGSNLTIEEVDEAEFDRVLGLNLRAPFFVTREALSRLRDNGRIVFISSTRTRRAEPRAVVYAPAKAGVQALALVLAQQLGPRGITVNAVLPGATATDSNPRASDPVAAREKAKEIALGRVGQPADIADVVAFLTSHDGRWVTGQSIDASGGQLL